MLLKKILLTLLLIPSVSSGGAASTQTYPGYTERLQQRAAFVARFAGEPLDSVKFRSFDGFEPLSTNSLIIYEKGSRGYLLTVTPCWDLPWSAAIGGIVSNTTINVKLNYISTAEMRKCIITEMRLVDVKAMKEAEKADKADKAG
jgi:hypothetical protein